MKDYDPYLVTYKTAKKTCLIKNLRGYFSIRILQKIRAISSPKHQQQSGDRTWSTFQNGDPILRRARCDVNNLFIFRGSGYF